MWYMYIMEYYLVIKKNEIMPFVTTWMDLEIIMLSEVKSDWERQILYITYTWNLNNNANELIYKTEIDSQTQKTNSWFTKGEREGGGINEAYGINGYILQYYT